MLWIPKGLRAVSVPHPGAKFLHRYASVTAGWSDLYGSQPTWQECLDRLRSYPVSQLLLHLAQINTALSRVSGPEAQVKLAHDLFRTRSSDLLQRLVKFAALPAFRDAERAPTLFHEAQVLNAAKLGLRYQDLAYDVAATSLEPLGEALLMLNDLAWAGTTAQVADAEANMVASALFTFAENPVHGLARAYELYFRSRPSIAAKHRVDLPAKLKEVTGVEPDILWTMIWALWAHFAKLTPEQAGLPFFPDQYLAPFSPEERRQVLNLVSSSAPALATALASFTTDDVRPYGVLEFAASPLVIFGDRAICLSEVQLQKKLITGLHYMLLDCIPSKKERDFYLIVRGDVVQEYVHELLLRCFPASTGVYIPADQLLRSDGGSVCDGALFYGDAIVFLEIKGKQFDLLARTGVRANLNKKLEDIVLDGAQQISETVRAFRSGALTIAGVKQTHVQTIYPVMILLEHLVMNPVTYERLTKDMKEKGVLGGLDTAAVQILNIAELEQVETGLENKCFSFLPLLKTKIASDEWRGATFKNYLIYTYPGLLAKHHNRYLRQVFDQRAEIAQRVVAERAQALP